LSLAQLKKLEDCVGDLQTAQVRNINLCLQCSLGIDEGNLGKWTAGVLFDRIPNAIGRGAFNFTKNKAIDILGKRALKKLFPNNSGKLPENQEEFNEDFAQFLAERVFQEIKRLSNL
jgi:hypothetical protein